MVWICEVINLIKATQRKTALELVTGAIGFKIIIDLPSLYYGAYNAPIKSKVGTLKATRGRKAERSDGEKMAFHFLYNILYVLHKWFFNVVYYYFFPFLVIFIPMVKVLRADGN